MVLLLMFMFMFMLMLMLMLMLIGATESKSNYSLPQGPGKTSILAVNVNININININLRFCCICIEMEELLQRMPLNPSVACPCAEDIFLACFNEEIFPWLTKKHQSKVKTKKHMLALWPRQMKLFKSIFEGRADLLRQEWQTRKQKLKNKPVENKEQTCRETSELKKQKKLKNELRQKQIAEQIAAGEFDEIMVSKKTENPKKHKQEKKIKKQKKKVSKPKNKKIKKWKDKKTKKTQAEWPKMKMCANKCKELKKVEVSLAQQLKQQSSIEIEIEIEKLKEKYRKTRIEFKVLFECENETFELDVDDFEAAQGFIDEHLDEIVVVKIWIFLDENMECILLNTDEKGIVLSLKQANVFEMEWTDFGKDLQGMINVKGIAVAFVESSRSLRIHVPLKQ